MVDIKVHNFELINIMVQRRRLELPQSYDYYPLKVARLPIPPSLHFFLIITYLIRKGNRE